MIKVQDKEIFIFLLTFMSVRNQGKLKKKDRRKWFLQLERNPTLFISAMHSIDYR
jgi:hypothetical protein